ncbi:MAG: hypothetical protein SGJ17_09305 [Hyphomicrobiales bacterium]|nr:hypothetical protein [Hyphomicrobiales bacterium]
MKFVAFIIAISFAALSALAPAAADYRPGVSAKKSKKSVRKYKRAPQVAGYRLRGGYRNGDEYTPYVYENDYGNYPRFDNRSFSERVMDGLRYEP